MKHILKILTNKIIISGLIIIAQFLLVLYYVRELMFAYSFIYIFMMILSLLLVIWVVNRDENPSYGMAWSIVILIFPPLGAVVYLLMGGRKAPIELRERITESFEGFEMLQDLDVVDDLNRNHPTVLKQSKYIYNSSHFPIYRARKAVYLESGEKKFEAMLSEIKKAEKFIFLEYFIIKDGYMWQTLRKALKEKIDEGVDVRLIYDDWGTAGFKDLKMQCDEIGIKTVVFNPIKPKLAITMNNRSHRKACIVDGRSAIVGGMNIADEYINKIERFGHWKDTAVLFEGEAVYSLTLMFLQFYRYYTKIYENPKNFKYNFDFPNKDKGFVQVFADAPTDNQDVGLDSHLNLINNAQDYVYIQTPYLIVGYEMIKALSLAAQSGVDVRIIVPGIPDKKIVNQVTKSNYEALIKNGVKIYEYTPGFVHSKTIVADDEICLIGTTNMDFRSYYIHYESTVLFVNHQVVQDCLKDVQDTFEISHLVQLEEVMSTPYFLRLFRGMIRIFSGLL